MVLTITSRLHVDTEIEVLKKGRLVLVTKGDICVANDHQLNVSSTNVGCSF